MNFLTDTYGDVISDNGEIRIDHPNRHRYRIVQNTPNEFHLEIRNVQLSDGVKYICSNSWSVVSPFYGTAEVVVIG